MELQDGFIVGIYNYCDRWCEACAFTSHCRSFALQAEMEARLDASHAELAGAPIAGGEPIAIVELPQVPSTSALSLLIAPEHRHIEARARGYAFHAGAWIRDHLSFDYEGRSDAANPIELILRYMFFITGKVFRALSNLRVDEGEFATDAQGSAKAALIGIERAHAAWLQLVERGQVSPAQAEPFIADLVWLGERLEAVFPHARAFVRPAFDEPEAVARLQ